MTRLRERVTVLAFLLAWRVLRLVPAGPAHRVLDLDPARSAHRRVA